MRTQVRLDDDAWTPAALCTPLSAIPCVVWRSELTVPRGR
jgi:hypothetical protein